MADIILNNIIPHKTQLGGLQGTQESLVTECTHNKKTGS